MGQVPLCTLSYNGFVFAFSLSVPSSVHFSPVYRCFLWCPAYFGVSSGAQFTRVFPLVPRLFWCFLWYPSYIDLLPIRWGAGDSAFSSLHRIERNILRIIRAQCALQREGECCQPAINVQWCDSVLYRCGGKYKDCSRCFGSRV